MKFYLLILFIAHSLTSCSQGNLLQQKVNALQSVEKMPYIPELSGDSLFWVVVMEKLTIVPLLIEKLNDTTITKATVPNFGGKFTVADIAYKAISEIIRDIPTMSFVNKSDSSIGGYWYYWDYVRKDYSNRLTFQTKVKEWYEKNKTMLKWKENNHTYSRTASDWKFPIAKHPAGGHYILEKK